MRKSLAVYFPVLIVGFFASLSRAQAQTELPDDRTIAYNIHADTRDPESPVLISTEVLMTAMERLSNEVGWYPYQIVITQYDSEGEIVETWTEDYPELTTSDSLWWVAHADPMEPTNAEFSKPPELSGTAVAQSPHGPTMNYFLVGKEASGPAPFAVTSYVDYSFERSDEPEPVDEGDDEPADVPEGDDGVG